MAHPADVMSPILTVHSSVINGPPSVLCFGAADPSGSSGVQADAMTLAALGCHPLSVLCAGWVRDTRRVEDVFLFDEEVVVAQARVVLEDVPVRAFRLGMLGCLENLVAVAEILSDYAEVPLVVEAVLDPRVHDEDAEAEDYAQALAELIVPQASLLLADRRELMLLAGEEADEASGGTDMTALIAGLGARQVWMPGAGPGGGDMLHAADGMLRLPAMRRPPFECGDVRGTLATAAAGLLAHGQSVVDAVSGARLYVESALERAYRPGMGPAVPGRVPSGDAQQRKCE